MKPQTKETGILMLVDSIEAASRTIDPPDRKQFEIMIQRIVFSKLSSGELDDCPLSMRELNIIVTRMADTLVSMHHHRIKYPWQVKQAAQFGVPPQAIPGAATPVPVPGPATAVAGVQETATTEFDGEKTVKIGTRH